jgi:hypothetical protein
MSDRGMKKWAPYASLIEQKGTISSMKNKRGQFKKPLLSQEMANDINAVLLIAKNKDVIVDYFLEGNKYQVSGIVTKMNYDQKWLVINDITISFATLLAINIR